MREVVRPARGILQKYGVKGFHELRAAYACERYEEITGHPAPIDGSCCYQQDKTLDQQADYKSAANWGTVVST